jgi:surface antigen
LWPATLTRRSIRSEATVQLSATDLDLLGDSIRRLNTNPQLQVGARDDWSNPATGSHGTSEVTKIFTSGKLRCHAMHHEISPQGHTPFTPYDVTWCRASDGKWKIKS